VRSNSPLDVLLAHVRFVVEELADLLADPPARWMKRHAFHQRALEQPARPRQHQTPHEVRTVQRHAQRDVPAEGIADQDAG